MTDRNQLNSSINRTDCCLFDLFEFHCICIQIKFNAVGLDESSFFNFPPVSTSRSFHSIKMANCKEEL